MKSKNRLVASSRKLVSTSFVFWIAMESLRFSSVDVSSVGSLAAIYRTHLKEGEVSR